VFDFDGVLVESVDVKTRAFAQLYEPHGPEVVARVVEYHLANGGLSRFEKFRFWHRNYLGKDLDPAAERALGDRFSRLVEDAVVECPWVPGALEFLVNHHRAYRVYVASGTPQEEMNRIVSRRRIAHFFSSVFGSPASKAQILQRVIACGFSPASVVMVGDSTNDFEGAREAGVRFIGRVPAGACNPFPPSSVVVPDLTTLAALL
jgi:phosphoglycolate phosphatase-like HAD superfamily hydrolase